MKARCILVFAFLVLIIACNNGEKMDDKVAVSSTEPLKGTIKLEVERALTIGSRSVEEEKQPTFDSFIKDRSDCIFIGDHYPNIAVYKFAKDGSYIKKFLKKGEGPGELLSLRFLQYIDDRIMAGSANKICEYDLDGNYISGTRLKAQYQEINMIDKQYFIANYQRTENKVVKRVCSIINRNNEDERVILLETGRKNIGQTILGAGKMTISLRLDKITPDYISTYNPAKGLIYLCLSDEPDIYITNRKGELTKVVKTNFTSWVLTGNDKNKVMEAFVRMPDHIKNMARKSLPKAMPAIRSLQVLPKNYLAVYFYKNWEEYEIRVYDQDGLFQYILEFPGEFSRKMVKFTKNGFACIEIADNEERYVEYRISNLPGIFSQ